MHVQPQPEEPHRTGLINKTALAAAALRPSPPPPFSPASEKRHSSSQATKGSDVGEEDPRTDTTSCSQRQRTPWRIRSKRQPLISRWRPEETREEGSGRGGAWGGGGSRIYKSRRAARPNPEDLWSVLRGYGDRVSTAMFMRSLVPSLPKTRACVVFPWSPKLCLPFAKTIRGWKEGWRGSAGSRETATAVPKMMAMLGGRCCCPGRGGVSKITPFLSRPPIQRPSDKASPFHLPFWLCLSRDRLPLPLCRENVLNPSPPLCAWPPIGGILFAPTCPSYSLPFCSVADRLSTNTFRFASVSHSPAALSLGDVPIP